MSEDKAIFTFPRFLERIKKESSPEVFKAVLESHIKLRVKFPKGVLTNDEANQILTKKLISMQKELTLLILENSSLNKET